jgi:hypothetical protein
VFPEDMILGWKHWLFRFYEPGCHRNKRGYVDGQLDNAKVSMDNVFHVIFSKPPYENAPSDDKRKDGNT